MYSYEIYDHDVGGNIHEDSGYERKELLSVVRNDITSYDFKEEAEFLEDEVALKDLETWDPAEVMDSLRSHDFCNGFCPWHTVLPGKHRELIVNLVNL